MDFWTSRQITEFIGIEKTFEEFREADPDLDRLESTRPDRKSKKHEEWYTQYCRADDDATERFVELFREKILVSWALRYDKEDDDGIALPPEYWAPSVASLTVTKGKVEGLLLDERHKHLANSRAVVRREDWEKWISPAEPGVPRSPDAQPSAPAKADQPQTDVELKDWFVKIYVPAHKDDSPNPTRDAALSAAKPKFANYCDHTHLRNDLRNIWRIHAPKEWKRTGPRAKIE